MIAARSAADDSFYSIYRSFDEAVGPDRFYRIFWTRGRKSASRAYEWRHKKPI